MRYWENLIGVAKIDSNGAGSRTHSRGRRPLRIRSLVLCPAELRACMVIPAGFEPGISALKGRRPVLLVEGTLSALLPELMYFMRRFGALRSLEISGCHRSSHRKSRQGQRDCLRSAKPLRAATCKWPGAWRIRKHPARPLRSNPLRSAYG